MEEVRRLKRTATTLLTRISPSGRPIRVNEPLNAHRRSHNYTHRLSAARLYTLLRAVTTSAPKEVREG